MLMNARFYSRYFLVGKLDSTDYMMALAVVSRPAILYLFYR